MTPRVAIVGGGISGLATAHFLRRDAEVLLFEATGRLGGKIRTERLGDTMLDVGPDGFLARKPDAAALCAELGLADALVPSAGAPPLVWTARGLRSLPDGLLLGVPVRPLAGAELLSPFGALRALGDLVLPARGDGGDESVGAIVRRRFGSEVLERLVEPIVCAVYAGRADALSARATTPWLVDAERRHRSIVLGMRALASNGTSGPPFQTLRGGLGRLVDALLASLSDADVRCGALVEAIAREDGHFRVEAGGRNERVDAVVVATPAPDAAGLVDRLAPDAARELRAIAYASVAIVALRYPASALARPPAETGFVVPPREGRLLTACTWSSVKWPHLADGPLLARCAIDERARELDDAALVERVDAELRLAAGITTSPTAARVVRWERALPLYAVGHLDRVARVARSLAASPGLVVTGAAYGGVGVPDCVRQARDAAAAVRRALRPAGGDVQ